MNLETQHTKIYEMQQKQSKGKVHRNKCLHQETRKISNKLNFTPQETKIETSYID